MRPESATVMRQDLEAIARALPRARSLAAVVQDLPEVVAPRGVDRPRPWRRSPRRSRAPRRRRAGDAADGSSACSRSCCSLAAAAWGVWTYVIPHTTPTPQVVGLSVDAATDRLRELGFTVKLARGPVRPPGARTGPSSAPTRPPAPSWRRAQTVTLVPSLGPPPTALPDVDGVRGGEGDGRRSSKRGSRSRSSARSTTRSPRARSSASPPPTDEAPFGVHRHADRQQGTRPGRGPRRGRSPRGEARPSRRSVTAGFDGRDRPGVLRRRGPRRGDGREPRAGRRGAVRRRP